MFTRFLTLRIGLVMALGGSFIFTSDAQTENVLTNVVQLNALNNSNVRNVVNVRLNGLVYGMDRPHGAIAFADATGLLWLTTEKLPDQVMSGSLITIEGTVVVGKGLAFLGKHSIVEGEYYADQSDQSGRVYLTAGKHALELLYHQQTQRAILDVTYQGPDLSRTTIPAYALSHSDTNTPTGFASGLHYDCYKGYSTEYPDFTTSAPNVSGIARTIFANFGTSGSEITTDVTDRKPGLPNVNYALRFLGFLQVDQPGIYQFYITADDGARLTLDYQSQCHFEVIGRTNVPAPKMLKPSQAWTRTNETVWATSEGEIEGIGELDGQLQLKLRGDSGPMDVVVASGPVETSAILLHSRVRVTGLAYGTMTFHGEQVAGKMLVPSMRHISILAGSEASWQSVPHTAISEVMKGNSTNLEKFPVNLSGTVTNVVPGRSFILRDGTREIEVRNNDIHTNLTGQTVDVLGLAEHNGKNTVLRYNIIRPHRGTNESSSLYTSIEQIRRLPDSAIGATNLLVKVKGTVLQVENGGLRASIRGESEGITVVTGSRQASALHTGDLCEFEGYLEWSRAFPSINYSKVTVLGHGQLPEPLHPTRNDLLNGGMDGQWVELQGVVLTIRPSASLMVVSVPGGEIKVMVSRNNLGDWGNYPNAVVRVRGVARTTFNKYSAPEDAVVQVDSTLDVTIVTPPPHNLFNIPAKRIPDLLAYDPNASIFPFVKVSGQIVFARGSTFYLMNGTNGMHFNTADKLDLVPGDFVDVVGIPENDRLSPNLKNSSVKRFRHGSLPQPMPVTIGKLSRDAYESTLVQFETTFLGISTNMNEQVLELQMTSTHVMLGRLDLRHGTFPQLLPQSKVRLTGVFTSNGKKDDTPPEILLSSPNDLVVLQTPPWWNVRRSVTALAFMAVIVVVAILWISTLRRRVERRTRQLRDEITGHQRTEAALNEKTILLQNEIEERKRIQIEVENIHRQLVDASRQAGQAEVAVNVLHNVGNVLNSVNISTTIVTDRIRKLRPANIGKAADLIEERNGAFSSTDEKGKQLILFLRQVALHWSTEQGELLTELRGLGQNIEHIKEIVVTQQAYAKRVGIHETIAVSEIVENALKVHSAAFARHSIRLERRFEECPTAILDKHKVLQILVNFFQNAKFACEEGNPAVRTVTVLIQHCPPGRFAVTVTDNGVGIDPENLNRIFVHGFTTRKEGHGFGLHSAALAAKEMGGEVRVHSDGLGKGAAFTLELPLEPQRKNADTDAAEIDPPITAAA